METNSEMSELRATGPSEHPGSDRGIKRAVSFWFFIRTTNISLTHYYRNANKVTETSPTVPKDHPTIVAHESNTGNVTPETGKDEAKILKDPSVLGALFERRSFTDTSPQKHRKTLARTTGRAGNTAKEPYSNQRRRLRGKRE